MATKRFLAIMTSIVVVGCSTGCEMAPAPADSPGTGKEGPGFLGQPRARILLLGTFHFKDAALDDYKPQFDVDILSEERQREVEEVLELLAAYEPTKIAVEWPHGAQQELDHRYRSFVAGDLELTSNEIHQLGFRLATRLDHQRLYAVDAKRRFYEPWVDPDEYAKAHGQEQLLDPHWDERFQQLYRHEDELKTKQTLREHLLYRNQEQRILQGHGHYLVDSFKVGVGDEYPGVDSKIAWYNRNLRIFANLIRITEREDERILLIIGAGHLPILRHAVQASPEYRLVEVSEVLGPG